MSSVRLSVRLSVCLYTCTLADQVHIDWKSWKLTARSISPTPSLFAAQTVIHLLPGEHGEIWGRLEAGWEKVACWSTKVAISLKRVKIEEKLLWKAYRNSPMFLRISEISPLLCSSTPLFPTAPATSSLPQISHVPLGVGRWPLGSEERRCWANCPCN